MESQNPKTEQKKSFSDIKLDELFKKAVNFFKALPNDEKYAYGAIAFGVIFLIIFLVI